MITPALLRAAYDSGGSIRLATSGTTGPARTVVRTAASWVDTFGIVAERWEVGAGARVWVPGPAAASMNSYAICLADHVGAGLVARPEEATHVFGTPTLAAALVGRELPALTLVVAGDRLVPPLADRLIAVGHRVHHYYGATQLSFVGWGGDADSLRLFPGVRAESRGGVVWVSSPWLCQREEGGESGLRAQVRDGERWMSVGDLGEITADGRITVSGRAGAVTTGGVTLVPAEIEAALRPYAGGEVIVVGRPHADLGAVLVAVCTDAGDVPVLRRRSREALPPAYRPRRWQVLADLPTTPAGKPDRARLTRLLSSKHDQMWLTRQKSGEGGGGSEGGRVRGP